LTEPDSSGTPKLNIVASPPGKRLQTFSALGGVKAMTALALLIAIFRYQPEARSASSTKWTHRSTKLTSAASPASSAT